MGSAFAGTLLLPGEEGPGLAAVLETVEDEIMLTAGTEHLGSWTQESCRVAPVGEGSFKVVLDGEEVLFTPETPAQFAEAMSDPTSEDGKALPLAERIAAHAGESTRSKKKPEKVMPLVSVGKGDKAFGRTVVMGIIAATSVLIVVLLLLSRWI